MTDNKNAALNDEEMEMAAGGNNLFSKENKFKVGDRVKWVSHNGEGDLVVGTVIELMEKQCLVKIDPKYVYVYGKDTISMWDSKLSPA